MSRREYYNKVLSYSDVLVFEDTANKTEIKLDDYYNNGCRYFGLFLVGGGGAGTGDWTPAGTCGAPGCGGQVRIFPKISISDINNPMTIIIGKGGNGGTRNKSAESGTSTVVTYDNIDYTALGGYGGWANQDKVSTYSGGKFQRIDGMAMPGRGMGFGTSASSCKTNIGKYYNTNFDNYGLTNNGTVRWWTIKGEDGILNPFEPGNITTYFGGAGSAGYNAYVGSDLSNEYPNTGGKGGGGRGGYGANNASTNRGGNATFYGGGGGSASFSSRHTNSLGGSGYQGLAIVYIYSPYSSFLEI